MGNCCCKVKKKVDYYEYNDVEFENLIDDDTPTAFNLNIVTEDERKLVSSRQYGLLTKSQHAADVELLQKTQEVEDLIRLEEDAEIQAKKKLADLRRQKLTAHVKPTVVKPSLHMQAGQGADVKERQFDDFVNGASYQQRTLFDTSHDKESLTDEECILTADDERPTSPLRQTAGTEIESPSPDGEHRAESARASVSDGDFVGPSTPLKPRVVTNVALEAIFDSSGEDDEEELTLS